MIAVKRCDVLIRFGDRLYTKNPSEIITLHTDLARVTPGAAVSTSVCLVTLPFCFSHRRFATGKITQIFSVLVFGHEATALPVDFIVTVLLLILVHIIPSHRDCLDSLINVADFLKPEW